MNAALIEESPTPTFILSAAEFWLLLGIAGAKAVFGISDPYSDQPAVEREANQQAALQSLLQRDLIRQINNDELSLQTALVQALQACIHPEQSLIVHTQNPDGTSSHRIIYLNAKLAVDCVEVPSGNYHLTMLPATPQFRALLSSTLNMDETPGTTTIDIAETVLNQARQECATGYLQAGIKTLEAANLPSPTASYLGQTLTTPITSTAWAWITSAPNEVPHVEKSFATWHIGAELWFLHPYQQGAENRVRLKVTNSQIIQAHLSQAFSQV